MINQNSEIIYISEPSAVNMEDEWYILANENNHFWMERRFEVFKKLLDGINFENSVVADVGCGSGIFLRQLKNSMGIIADGIDLNNYALTIANVPSSKLYCYDITEKNRKFYNRYDLVILFDVIEHIEDDEKFLSDIIFMLKKGGLIAINVPAFMWLYSKYDKVLGHYKRYTIPELLRLAHTLGLSPLKSSYWGICYVPLLITRKFLFKLFWIKDDDAKTTQKGFSIRSKLLNRLLSLLGKIEIIPQHVAGTSVMIILRKES